MRYLERLQAIQEKNRSWLCVGLDPDPALLPPYLVAKFDEPVLPFMKAIIDETVDLVCAYKPNLGFYLQWGAAGIIALERTIKYIPPEIPVILDCKTGDIGHTQLAWAKGAFEEWNVAAMTVNPYIGLDAIVPVVQAYPTKAIYVLAHTSNPSAKQFQGDVESADSLVQQVVAQTSAEQHPHRGHIGYVVGATYPTALQTIRQLAPTANFLIPGIGTQGGELASALQFGPDAVAGPVINVGRAISYASRGEGFAAAARAAALTFRAQMQVPA